MSTCLAERGKAHMAMEDSASLNLQMHVQLNGSAGRHTGFSTSSRFWRKSSNTCRRLQGPSFAGEEEPSFGQMYFKGVVYMLEVIYKHNMHCMLGSIGTGIFSHMNTIQINHSWMIKYTSPMDPAKWDPTSYK